MLFYTFCAPCYKFFSQRTHKQQAGAETPACLHLFARAICVEIFIVCLPNLVCFYNSSVQSLVRVFSLVPLLIVKAIVRLSVLPSLI